MKCDDGDAHVADLHFIRDAAEGDDRPVLKFKRRDDAQLLHRPRQVADDEAASGAPERFASRQAANVAQAFGHDAQAWAKYQCQSHARIFKGTADDSHVPWVEDPIETVALACHFTGMNILLLMVVLLLLFGGGGFYFGGPMIGGGGLGLVLLICLIVFFMGGFRNSKS